MGKRSRLTTEERERRKHQRSADRKNGRARAEIGPLFAEQAPVTTAEEQYWHWRRNVALAADHGRQGAMMLSWLEVCRFREEARRLVDAATFDKLCAVANHLYGEPAWHRGSEYHWGHWMKVLTGERIVLAAHGEPTGDGKFRYVEDEVFPPAGFVPPYTREAFYAKYLKRFDGPPDPGDVGLFRQLFPNAPLPG